MNENDILISNESEFFIDDYENKIIHIDDDGETD
jgi:hypothetical protein